MRLVILVVLSACFAIGQTIPEPVLTEVGDNHVVFCTDKTPSEGIINIRLKRSDNATWTTAEWENCQYNANGCTNGYAGTGLQNNVDLKPNMCIWALDLTPNTTYLMHINFYDDDVTSWTSDTDATYQTNIQAASVCAAFPSNCTDIDADGGGAGTDRVLQITTTNVTPTEPDAPDMPVHARSLPTALPTIDNEVDVTVVGSGECDVQAKITSQVAACIAAATSPVVYSVKIPYTANGANACRPEEETAGAVLGYTIPDITDTDCTFILRSESQDTDVDPPFGGLIAEDAVVGTLKRNITAPTNSALLSFEGSGDQNVYIHNIRLEQPLATETNYTDEVLTERATNGSNKPTVTFTNDRSTSEWPPNFKVYFSDAESRPYRSGLLQTNDTGGPTWSKSGLVWTMNGSLNPAEADSTVDGVASIDPTTPFTLATATSTPTLTFSSNLNIASGFEYTLAASGSVASGVVSVASGDQHYSAGNFMREALLIEGATGTGCNDIHTVTNANMSSGTWTITNTGISCDGGTAQILLKAYVHDMSGYTTNQMSCLVEVLTQTTAKLHKCTTTTVDTAFVPDFTGMTVTGYMAFAPIVQQPLLALGSATGVNVISTLIDMAGPPWIFYRGISASGQDTTNKHIFMGNRIINGRRYQMTDPVTGLASSGSRDNNNGFFRVYDCEGCIDNQWINNVVETCENFLLSSNGTSVEYPKDLTIDGLIVKAPQECYSSNANHGGLHSNSRQQPFEFKNGGDRIYMNGLWVDNQHIAVTKNTAAVLCQSQTSASNVQDYVLGCFNFTIQNSFFRGNQVLYFKTISSTGTAATYAPFGPLKFDNNFIVPKVIVSKPSGDTGFLDSYLSSFVPTLIELGAGTRDITITDNTYAWRVLGANSTQDYNQFLDLTGDVQPPVSTAAIRISGNAYVDMDSDNSNLNALGIDGGFSWSNYEAQFQEDGAFTSVGGHNNNTSIPCTESPNTHDFDTNNNAHTETTGRLTGAGGSMSTNWAVPGSSADAQPCNTRLDLAFTAGTWEPTGSSGADVNDIFDAVGQIRDISVSSITASTASITITPPSSSMTCHLIWKAGPVSSFAGQTGVTRLTSSSGATRTFNLTGLPSNSFIDAQAQCARGPHAYVSFETE